MTLPMPIMEDYTKTFGDRMLDDIRGLVPDPSRLLNQSLAETRVPSGSSMLDILSADSYPSAPIPERESRSSTKRRASQQMYGGFTVEETENGSSTSSNDAISDDKAPPKKRPKRSSKSEEDDLAKKQRGRPRLDTQDETAADRRRTQIRLAQRAYRHRKETTISALKKKVGKMQKTIELMSKSFSQLHDNLIDTGLFASRPDLAQQLQRTEEYFASVASSAADSHNEDETNRDDQRRRSNSADAASEHEFNVGSNREPRGNEANGIQSGFDLPYAGGPGDDVDVDVQDLQLFAPQNEDLGIPGSDLMSSVKDWPANTEFQQYHVQMPAQPIDVQTFYPTLERPLKPAQPYTYSFQETTFSRRLHRLCLERGFRYLTSPILDRDSIERAFRFTFCYSNRKSLLVRFQALLKRKAGESLENWNVPFFRIGGAGTHFPRRDASGKEIYPPNMHSPAGVFRPLRWLPAETPRTEETTEKMLEAIGYGGEWFDSHDVEEYLKTKGIYLDGSSSFVEVDPSAISMPALTTTASTPILDPALSPLRTPSPILEVRHLDRFLDEEVQHTFGLYPLPGSREPKETGTWAPVFDFDMSQPQAPGYAPTLRDVMGNQRTPVTVDVSKFLERMVDGAACLGRAPGFRKQHIDNALALSLQEAF